LITGAITVGSGAFSVIGTLGLLLPPSKTKYVCCFGHEQKWKFYLLLMSMLKFLRGLYFRNRIIYYVSLEILNSNFYMRNGISNLEISLIH